MAKNESAAGCIIAGARSLARHKRAKKYTHYTRVPTLYTSRDRIQLPKLSPSTLFSNIRGERARGRTALPARDSSNVRRESGANQRRGNSILHFRGIYFAEAVSLVAPRRRFRWWKKKRGWVGERKGERRPHLSERDAATIRNIPGEKMNFADFVTFPSWKRMFPVSRSFGDW